MPLSYGEIHIVNCPRVAEMAYKVIKPLLGERIREKIKFHATNTILQQHVDKAILTDDQDGGLDHSETTQSVEAALKARDLFKDIKKFAYGE